jgi:acetyl-CoA carboxylase biotin carboxylase subunit
MLKAVAGGGGKALRLVQTQRGIRSAYRAVKSEARSFFGDDRLYVEKYIDRPRHVEIQIIADRAGHTLHLYDRECSIQRRHQKVIEESPAPAIDHKIRKAMGKIAVEGAKAVGYVGVGTLEFLVDRKKRFYFLEMNTRLQVEHPVTERVVGIDLVKAQIEIAAGKKLPWKQRHISQKGSAIECRIYAEDPENNFMPCPGKIQSLRSPAGFGVRVDGGVYEGSVVPIHYDPLIAKLVVWGENREEVILRTRRALREYQIAGIKTNIPFHLWVLRHPGFIAGDYDTHFVEEEFPKASRDDAYPHKEAALAAAAIAALKQDHRRALRMVKGEGSDRSLWKEIAREEAVRRTGLG